MVKEKKSYFKVTFLVFLFIAFVLCPISSFAGDVIKVGAPLPLTGDYAADGEHQLMGLQMAVKDINAAGGLLGSDSVSSA